jgi:cytochrome c peroxidase
MAVVSRVLIVESCVLALLPVAMARQAEPIVPVDQPAAIDQARASLGERLFSDTRLSRAATFACATCHPLESGGMDGLTVATPPRNGLPARNTPTIFNAALNAAFNWDGAARTLEEHTGLVVRNIMDFEWPALLERLRGVAEYETGFARVYPNGVSQANVIDAIVSFERTLITPDAPFDRYLRGEEGALTAAARAGYQRFKANGCASCHQGMNAGGNLYQRFGIFKPVPAQAAAANDEGRFRATKVERDKFVFRVPGLRNVAVTAPYFHDGRAATLEHAVEVMGRHQLGRTLAKDDVRLIVEFLRSLTGEYRGRRLHSPRQSGTEIRSP